MLGPGDDVGIARSEVHYVITECGIAYLFGMNAAAPKSASPSMS